MNWKSFLNTVFLGDKEIADTMQRLVGYAVTGDKTAGIIVVCHGNGRNGRSTFFEGLRLAMGKGRLVFAHAGSFVERDETLPSPWLFAMRDARVAVFNGVMTGGRSKLSRSHLKAFSTDEQLEAREVYGRAPVRFRNQATPFLDISQSDINRYFLHDLVLAKRCVFIPFPAVFAAGGVAGQGQGLTAIRSDLVLDGLKADLPTICAWIEDGVQLYRANGLGIPERFRVAGKTARRAV